MGEVLPDLAMRRAGGAIRLWSAACGTGQEVYSLAMALAESAPAGVTVEVFASDLCERRLEKAQAGVYSQFEVQRGLSARRLVTHFEGLEDGFVLSPRVSQMVRWRRVNLMEDLGRLGQFDLVLCRRPPGLPAGRRPRPGAGQPGAHPGARRPRWLVLGASEAATGAWKTRWPNAQASTAAKAPRGPPLPTSPPAVPCFPWTSCARTKAPPQCDGAL